MGRDKVTGRATSAGRAARTAGRSPAAAANQPALANSVDPGASPRDTVLSRIKLDVSSPGYFVGRSDLIRLFCSRLQEPPATPEVIFLHGDGGNGKSSLLRFLRDKCCKLLYRHHWREAKDLADPEFVDKVMEAPARVGAKVTSAELNLADDLYGEETRSLLGGVKTLHRVLAGQGLRFPVYDFAFACYLKKAGRLAEELQRSFTSMAPDFASAAGADLVAVSLKFAVKILGEKFEIWRKGWGVDQDFLENLQALDQHRLGLRLPELLALDLMASTAPEAAQDAPKRVVLFIDGHERLQGPESSVPAFEVSGRDEWLRRLVKPLLSPQGRQVLVVVAGRQQPDWTRASGKYAIDAGRILARPVGHLSPDDSEDYLRRRGITDGALQDAILACAQVRAGEIHPLYLSLCADTVAAASRDGRVIDVEEFRQAAQATGVGEEILARLLSQVKPDLATAITALSGCRSFDYDTFSALGRSLGFPPGEATFNTLTSSFSFVWRTDDESGTRFRIHDLVRRLVREGELDRARRVVDPATVRRADEILEAHYRSRASSVSPASIADAIYHAYQLDPGRAIGEWLGLFESDEPQGNYALGQALLAIRGDITPGSPGLRGRMAAESGRQLDRLARYEEAEAEFRTAIRAYDEALALAPREDGLQVRKANALWRLGDLLDSLSRHGEAGEAYERAVAVCDEALRLAPEHVSAHYNRGVALSQLGRLLAGPRPDDAKDRYTEGIAAYDQVLLIEPEYSRAHNGRGVSLWCLGRLLAASDPDEAKERYTQAIAAYDQALRIAPDYAMVHRNRGIALSSLGDLLAGSRPDEARDRYTRAIAAYDQVLRIAPDYALAHNSRGVALSSLGCLLAASDPDEAKERYTQAIAAYDQALRTVPDYAPAHNIRGDALSSLGCLLAASDPDEAKERYTQAIAAYDQALRIASDDALAHKNRGSALSSLGNLLAGSQPA